MYSVSPIIGLTDNKYAIVFKILSCVCPPFLKFVFIIAETGEKVLTKIFIIMH